MVTRMQDGDDETLRHSFGPGLFDCRSDGAVKRYRHVSDFRAYWQRSGARDLHGGHALNPQLFELQGQKFIEMGAQAINRYRARMLIFLGVTNHGDS